MKTMPCTMIAAIVMVALASGKDLESGGVTFRLPEKGGGVCVVENGKATRLFHTNLRYSDAAGRRHMAVEWKKPNRIEKLDAALGRTVYRVTYPLKDTDALQFSASGRTGARLRGEKTLDKNTIYGIIHGISFQ